MANNLRIFEFKYDDNIDIIVAKDPQQAIIFYINDYASDLIDDVVRFNSLKIKELIGTDIVEKHEIFNENTGKNEIVSYWDIAKEFDAPSVIATTNY